MAAERSSRRALEWALIAAATIGIVAVLWLGPLMTDQVVFFGDREQTRVAEGSRIAMLPLAVVLIVVATVLGRYADLRLGALATLPAVAAVPLAWGAPATAYQVVAYAFTAPIALGALVAAVLPPLRRLMASR